jgi:hypothetical protein
MIVNNFSPAQTGNKSFVRVQAKRGEGNVAWLERVLEKDKVTGNGILLIGGSSVINFHIRVAQSRLRHNLTPSHWSMVGVLGTGTSFYSVPLDWKGDLSELPHSNAIELCDLRDYDNSMEFPNIAYVEFTSSGAEIIDAVKKFRFQRSVIDLPVLVIRWLEYVWATGEAGNPLMRGHGLPSAVFAEAVYGISGIELTPGLSTASSCPEAIWQAAKWWRPFYEEASTLGGETQAAITVPTGSFALRQPAAAIYEKPRQQPAAKTKRRS